MSTQARPTPAVGAGVEPEIHVVSHTGLLYWWPVWLVGFVLSLLGLGSTVPLRGLCAVFGIMFVLMVTMLLACFDAWGWILDRLGGLHMEISLAAYLLPSVVLLILWVLSVFAFDRLRYMRFKA